MRTMSFSRLIQKPTKFIVARVLKDGKLIKKTKSGNQINTILNYKSRKVEVVVFGNGVKHFAILKTIKA